MRSQSLALLITLPLVLSFAACAKKDQSQSPPAGSNQPAPTTAVLPLTGAPLTPAPSGSQPQTPQPQGVQVQVPQPGFPPNVGLPKLGALKVGPVTLQFQDS